MTGEWGEGEFHAERFKLEGPISHPKMILSGSCIYKAGFLGRCIRLVINLMNSCL